MNIKNVLIIAVSICASMWWSPVVAQTTALYFTSSPTSYVGAGQTRFLYDSNASFTIRDFGLLSDVYVDVDISPGDFFNLSFLAPEGSALSLGRYENTSRFPAENAGLNFSGQGRGPNSATGHFQILDLSYNTDGSIDSFAANFTQFDNGNADQWNFGEVRYRSFIPIVPIPEPPIVALLLMGIVGVAHSRLSRCKRMA